MADRLVLAARVKQPNNLIKITITRPFKFIDQQKCFGFFVGYQYIVFTKTISRPHAALDSGIWIRISIGHPIESDLFAGGRVSNSSAAPVPRLPCLFPRLEEKPWARDCVAFRI